MTTKNTAQLSLFNVRPAPCAPAHAEGSDAGRRSVAADPARAAELARLRAIVAANRANGREQWAGLTSSEIGTLNRALMFGDNDEAFPSAEEWSRIVD